MPNNRERTRIAGETVAALERGLYHTAAGQTVSLTVTLERCVAATQCYDPDALAVIRDKVLVEAVPYPETGFEVVNERSLQGTTRLTTTAQYDRVGVLNFASAKNPGGGFLGGAQAQEESLARSSGLYSSLLHCPDYYKAHKAFGSSLYSDRMIYSPACPVFRDDDGTWLERPYLVDFITSPAPNAGAIRANTPEDLGRVESVLRERGNKLLALAAHHGCDALVLGAWGCGVFRNDPVMVAAIFGAHLRVGGGYWGRFRHILFSVFDTSATQTTFAAFAAQFG
jgi:uncharacterized protein (TIGR02452 family)